MQTKLLCESYEEFLLHIAALYEAERDEADDDPAADGGLSATSRRS